LFAHVDGLGLHHPAVLVPNVAGYGIAQPIELGLAPMLTNGELVQILADWLRLPAPRVRAICRRKGVRFSQLCAHQHRADFKEGNEQLV
jgi:hypothetical protein